MSWKQRGKRRYYYRTERVGRQVVSRYIGHGPIADLVAAQVENDKRQREAHKRLAIRLRESVQIEADLEALCKSTDLLVRISLITAGYRRHHRGEWRKRRDHR